MESVLGKISIHITNFVLQKDLKLAFYWLLTILNRRLLRINLALPQCTFRYYPSTPGTEHHLTSYMEPLHNGCFIDVGANIGLWTLPLAKRGVTIHAFEPSPRSFKHLKKATRKFANIQLYPYALGQRNEDRDLFSHYQTGHDSLVKPGRDYTGHKVKTKVRTLDSFKLENVGLIKIDTEGSEAPILLGAKQTILRCKPRLIIEVHCTHSPDYKEDFEEVTGILERYNYTWITRYKTYPKPPRYRQPHIIGDPK